MTDPKALIAEAREKERQLNKLCRAMLNLKNEKAARDAADHAGLLLRLAAALEEATVPEGWRVTEYVKGAAYSLKHPRVAMLSTGDWVASNGAREFPTAREAMAALDGKGEISP